MLAARDLRAVELESPSSETLLQIYAWMQLARTGDNRILDLFRQGLIKGTVTGGQGNEGLIVPLALLADKAIDVTCFTHRDLGGHLIWSGHLCQHLNQYFANAGSPTKAREGNVHRGDPKNRSLPMISHLGAMLGPVLGMTDSQRRRGHRAVGFAFFGDGSSSTGDVHESLNLASLLNLPILFVIENNCYAYSTPMSEQFCEGTALWRRAAGYGIEGLALDATTDVAATARTLAAAIEKVRSTSRPMLIEAQTLRLRGHAAYDTCDYLKPGESEGFFARDPLPKFRQQLAAAGHGARLDAIDAELSAFIEACIKVSLAVERPAVDVAALQADVFAPGAAPLPWKPAVPPLPTLHVIAPSAPSQPPVAHVESGTTLTFAQAITAALRKILAEQPDAFVLGQDIGTYGGAFKVTEGLLKEFGRSRVFNTPLAESACTGYAVGMALNGHRPVEEFQFADFATEAITQITLNAATLHFRSGAACPLVLRLPCGGGVTLGSFHSQELESFLLAMPGLKALYPSNPQDAFDAMLAAYEDPNPVLFFEHKGLYRRLKQAVVWNPNYRDVWQPKQLRTGDYATVVSYGEMVHLATEVCDYLAAEYEHTLDLFDLRCLSPLRLDAIHASVARTGRLVVLHEGRRTHGFGAELVARLTEQNFATLKAAPLRIGSLDIPVPFAPELEQRFRPTLDSVIEQVTAWMG
ncbi:thiamine pyrophosphate-dependent enzyme [Opitutus terrae]|uniref:Transketolase central region n=1 Tax=Opitutus terrae (strain DSM 11246 / JCM 15787 / PB90-1) TaxID=452637 RepID=B1ZNY8_OPITP|nr:thiamine pyrophosphate-dependent enzyme [Opitutus terrae]ACB77477.1 Transketolase central region [Opitutus terrae PB90-1]